MAREWKIHRIGDIAAAMGDAPFGSLIKNHDYTDSGALVVQGKNIQGRTCDWSDRRYVSREKYQSLRRSHCMAGDILFPKVGTIGKVGILTACPGVEEYVLSTNTMRFRADPKVAIADYVYYFFTWSETVNLIHAMNSNSVQPVFNFTSLKNFEIPLPPLAEQKAIAAVLGALDDKIELNRRMNATLEAMARALFQSWFVDFDPVRAKLDGRPPAGLDPATAALFPDHLEDSQLGHIPRGWKVISLPEEIDFLEGPGLRNWQYRDEGMKFLNIRCIGDGDLDIAKANCISLEEFEETYKHFALQEDDIVISTSGTLGRLAIVRAGHLPVMLNTSIIRMRGRGAVGLGYVWGFLQSEYFLAEMFALAAGSVQLNFGPMHLRQILILRPPDGILKGFERAVQPLLRKCLQLRKESRTLATLRDTLLPKLLSGELSVNDSKSLCEETGQ